MTCKGDKMADVSPWVQTVIGGLMTLAGGSVAHWMTLGREREARRSEGEVHRNRQRADFQIKSLTELQDALCRIMKSAYPLADIDYHDTFSGAERDKQKSSRLWNEWQDAFSMVTVYSVRVQDPEVRQAVDGILKMASSLVLPLRRKGDDLEESREETEELRDSLMKSFERLNQRIGECLRDLY
jgi:hypothetical protein